jgi:hypothetical protein
MLQSLYLWFYRFLGGIFERWRKESPVKKQGTTPTRKNGDSTRPVHNKPSLKKGNMTIP